MIYIRAAQLSGKEVRNADDTNYFLELGPDTGGPRPPDPARRGQLLRFRDLPVRPEAATRRPGPAVAEISSRRGEVSVL